MVEAKVLFSKWLDEPLFQRALCHRSIDGPDNERLEFIGDAVLGMLVARRLYDMFPDASEGDLSRMRARLVRGETLAELARATGLDEMITLGAGEEANRGRDKDSILSGAFEAALGAVYRLSGVEATDDVIVKVFGDRIEEASADEQMRDAKTRLQESLQTDGGRPPTYTPRRVSGRREEPLFEVRCRVADLETVGEGPSVKKASRAAAKKMLDLLDLPDLPGGD